VQKQKADCPLRVGMTTGEEIADYGPQLACDFQPSLRDFLPLPRFPALASLRAGLFSAAPAALALLKYPRGNSL
jgi:hypothetical protein